MPSSIPAGMLTFSFFSRRVRPLPRRDVVVAQRVDEQGDLAQRVAVVADRLGARVVVAAVAAAARRGAERRHGGFILLRLRLRSRSCVARAVG